MATYLDFENGIRQIDEDIANAKIKGDSHAVEVLEKNLSKEISNSIRLLRVFLKHKTKEDKKEEENLQV